MNGCENCLVYRIRHNLCEPIECENCGKKTMVWKHRKGCMPSLKCSECSWGIGVDMNMPCELDSSFRENVIITIEPQKSFQPKDVILKMTKVLGLNSLQMHKGFTEGYSVEMPWRDADKIVLQLKECGIEHRLEGYKDLREKYPYYKDCEYPYSAMRVCLSNEKML